ncbi:Gfo/Idh/MocA family protein [Horticoccus sp. 23ND18S-11]|uniref:Gfo/Idh/MocA family protein n=1 Tax=Horticoccus sp. 23ND18S-11 TaxID=3391832 RepID=UPI0039C9DCB7
MRKINWGVLSTAKIGVNKVIPALQASQFGTVAAIASRDLPQAQAAAQRLAIPRAHGSYEALLADPGVDAVYIPLPNHLHVPWSIRALEAGKHVLCEKPIGLNSGEAQQLIEAARRFPQLKIMEAFMYRHHPQWQLTRRLIAEGKIGQLRTVHSHFSYWNVDPKNIRNQGDIGGGGMMDIGCYCVSLSRFVFGAEPRRVLGLAENDPAFGVDRLASGVMEFPNGTATFTCSTQLSGFQRVMIFGTEGRIEIEIPFNAPPDRPTRLWHQRGPNTTEIPFKVCDQYSIQGDLFARAILDDTPVPTPLDDALANMRVIEAVLASAGMI